MAEILLYTGIPLLIAAVFVAAVALPQYLKRSKGTGPQGQVLYRGPLAVSLACMLVGLMATVHYAEAARQAEYAEARTHFLHEVDQLEGNMQGQVSDLEHLLSSLRGLFVSSAYVSRSEFRAFEEARDAHLDYPGFRGLGFIERVPRARLPAFEARMRQEFGAQYRVQTVGSQPDLFVIRYLEPLSRNASALGYDLGSEPVRRAAAEAAMRSGQATMTPPITLIQDTLKRPGFLLLLPVYAGTGVPATSDERESRLTGWAYSPVVFSELMAVASAIKTSALNFQIFASPDLSQSALIYDSLLPAGGVNQPESLQRGAHSTNTVVRPMLVADQLLYLRANASPAFEAGYHPGEHLNSALLGSGTSVLGAMVLWLLMVGRARALDLAKGMTHDLERLAMVAKRTSNAVYFADTEWRISWINEGFTRMCGFSEAESLGLRPSQLLHSPLADPATAERIDARVAQDQRINIQVLQRSKNGRDYWADLEVITVFGADGRITGYMSVQSDITEEVQAKAALVLEKERAENILSGTNVGTWESNLLTGEQRWNDRWSAMMGFTREEVVPSMAEFLRQRLHTADQPRLHRALVECVTGRSDNLSCEARVMRKDGSWMWILNRAKVMSRSADGRAEWVGGILADITELKQVELSLRDMEAFLDRAGRIAGVGAWQMDLQTRELVFSPQTREIHGLEHDALLTEEVALSFYPEPDRTRVRDALRNAEQGGTSWDLVVQLQTVKGQLRWVRIFCEVWFDDNGPVRLMGAFQDVTKDRLAQIEAEQASAKRVDEQRRLQSILEGTNVGTWEWNLQTDQSIYNEQYVGMLGYTLQEIEAGYSTWVRLVHPDDLVLASEQMQRHLRGERDHYEIEVRMQHKQGHWIWVLAKGRLAQRTEDGAPLWVYGTHMDITDRKRATEELAQTTAMLQNVLDSATAVGVMTLGLDHTLRVFNRGAENLLGYSAHELVGGHSADLFFDRSELGALGETLALVRGHEPEPQEVFAQVVQTRDEQEWTLVRKNATRFKASLIFSPMRDVHGVLQGHLAMVYDISKQKEYESSLREAMRLAEQSSVAKSQFLANMSHEIRTPMNAILGMLQLMRNTPLNPQQHDYTDKAVGAARSLLGLLNDILDFSKVEAGKMQLNPEPFEVNGLLADLSVILSSNLGNKAVDLVFDIDPAIPPMLVGDAMRLKQILINLGGNAVKFTDSGEVALRLNLLARTHERVKLAVAVVDSGIGIAPENQARIFDAFTQAEANTTRRFGGTGLGLVISTRLIRLMGGELQLSSALGKGSTFSFTLELQTADFALEAEPVAAALPAPVVRVLLVDDNPHALASAARMLRAIGWEVLEAASGAQALECLHMRAAEHAAPLNAVFADADMPDMDGWATLRNVRRLFEGMDAPLLILLSRQSADALAQRSDREHDLLDGLLVRPVTGPLFAKALEQAQSGTQSLTLRQASPKRLQGMRILLVEDNLINQQVAQELLEGLGARVTLANDGALGVAAVRAAQPGFHAVLMDLQMPVMDGLSATRLLRRDARYADLPVIAMTANAMHSDREECLAAGMNDHVGKPFDLNQLVQTLMDHTHWVKRSMPLPAPDASVPEGPVSPVPAAEAWPAGLDIEQALARMGGERQLLQRAIAAFVTDARLLPERLEQGLQQGALDNVKRELHSAKGLAATVGATALAGLAAIAEKRVAAAEAPADCVACVAQFSQQLRQQLPALEAAAMRLQGIQAQVATPASGGLSEGERAQWHQLLAALEASDMVAIELHAKLRQQMEPAADPALEPALEALDQAMAELDFDAAAAACAQLVHQFDNYDTWTLT